MRTVWLPKGKLPPEERADESVIVHEFQEWKAYSFLNDEDFVREKEDKLLVRRMNRRKKNKNRWNNE